MRYLIFIPLFLAACAKTERVEITHPDYDTRLITLEQMILINSQEDSALEARVVALEIDMASLKSQVAMLNSVAGPAVMAQINASIAVLQANTSSLVMMQQAILSLQQQVSSIKTTKVEVNIHINNILTTLSKCYSHIYSICGKKCK